MKPIIIALILLIIGRGAAHPMTQAELDCRYEAAKVGGYDWADSVLRRGEVFRMCMQRRR